MAITMGLQQVSNTLNKDSAFSLVTLNKLKEYWNKLMGDSVEEIEEENAAVLGNTSAKNANAASTETGAAAETSKRAATVSGTAATNAQTGAEVANTGAKTAHTAATVALTFATKAASVAMRGLKAALISTGIGALIVLVGELVGWLVKLIESTGDAKKEQEELNKIASAGYEAYAKASVEISDYNTKIEHFNGTQEQEKKLVNELNTKYGEQMGYYMSLSEWKDTLMEKGEAYCKVLIKEAEAQAILSKYTEAYIALQEARNKDASEFGHWYTTNNKDRQEQEKAVAEAQKEANKWLKMYNDTLASAQELRDKYDLNPHIDPTKIKSASGNGKTFDPAQAALNSKKAIDEYQKAVQKYIADANDELNAAIISGQEQGLTRELNEIRRGTAMELKAWNERLQKLAEMRRDAAKTQYMNTKGATEVGWANSMDGKKSVEDWIAVIKRESPGIIAEFDRVWKQIEKNGDEAIAAAQRKYVNALIDEFGTAEQRAEKLAVEWQKKLATIPEEFLPQAIKKMEEEFSKLDSDNFKVSIGWESVFGNLTEQAIPVLKRTLGQVRQFFEANKASMSTEDIKNYQEAIANMENEIASRNPFSAMQKSINDIKASKVELVSALVELKGAQEQLNEAIKERNAAQQEYNDIIDRVSSGELSDDSEEKAKAANKLADAVGAVTKARERCNNAEQRASTAQNANTKAYKNLANSLKGVGEAIGSVGQNAEKLAEIFNSDVAKKIGKAMTLFDSVLDASTTVINAIGDLGKGVAQGIETTVDAAAMGSKSAAAAGAAAISTIEKASVILAVISAALQVATAIANLFSNDDELQDEIDSLQRRIDQLQWELDNSDILLMNERYSKAIDIMNNAIDETNRKLQDEYKNLYQISNIWERINAIVALNEKAFIESADRIATAYANMGYTADKALGADKFKDTRKQLENIAQQQLLIQNQIEDEYDKKDTDQDKIEEWKEKIEELGHDALSLINDIIEEIIGGTSNDIAEQLSDAFFEAFGAGEDAAQAWGDKVNEIIADVLKRMMVSKFLEEPLGEIFDKYKAKWFRDGNFAGIDEVVASMTEFRNDLNSTYGTFANVMEAIPEDLRSLLVNSESSREAAEKGIAQASQDSVDELNGRTTAIQGHTYSIAENTKLLLQTTNLILKSVLNIEENTNGVSVRMERMEGDLKEMRDIVSDISLRGVKIK